METKTIRIGGMTCVNCQKRIEKKLKNTAGIENAVVSFNKGTAAVAWNPQIITFTEIKAAIEGLHYRVLDAKTPAAGVPEAAGTLIIIAALFLLFRGLGISTIASAFPLAETGMGYGMLFIVGLITSVHCAAMCGGINLSQTLRPGKEYARQDQSSILMPAILYNAGRVVSYTMTGIIVGALGQVLTVSGRFQGIIQIIAGIFMVLMGISMLGFFPGLRRFMPRMPKFFAGITGAEKGRTRGPLVIGLLNGLMPCGPLQAMQLYALSTGSPAAGGISMFLFSMGTIPLMFGIGALSSFLSGGDRGRAFTRRVMKIGAILVTVMGLTMFSYGFGLSGFNFTFTKPAIAAAGSGTGSGAGSGSGTAANPGAARTDAAKSVSPPAENDVQIVNSTLSPAQYPAITVQQGIPVRWTINASQNSITGCNNRMIIREYDIVHRFTPGENIIEFTPERAGKFYYSCWMGMIRSSITVAARGESLNYAD